MQILEDMQALQGVTGNTPSPLTVIASNLNDESENECRQALLKVRTRAFALAAFSTVSFSHWGSDYTNFAN